MTESIKAVCYCGEEKELYFPCQDEKLAMEQLEWLFRHLKEHNGIYYDVPFGLDVTTLVVDWGITPNDDSTPQEVPDKE